MEIARSITGLKLKASYNAEVAWKETMVLNDNSYVAQCSKKIPNQVHADMVDSFKALVPHLIVLSEIKTYEEVLKMTEEELAIYHVTGITISGEHDHEGVTLTGYKDLGHGKQLNLIPPFTKFNPEQSTYSYCQELQELVFAVQHEGDAYLIGKFAPDPQLDLFDKPEDDVQVTMSVAGGEEHDVTALSGKKKRRAS